MAILNSGMLLENNPLKFNKTGKEIKIALEARKAELTKEDEDIVKEIEEIAKRRELDPAEVIKAADNEQLIESYSTKALNAVVGSARHMPGGIWRSMSPRHSSRHSRWMSSVSRSSDARTAACGDSFATSTSSRSTSSRRRASS